MQLLGVCVALPLTGCWVEEAAFTTDVVWSDDATEVAFTVLWHDIPRRQRNESENEQTWKNREYQIFRVPRDLSDEPTALGGRRSSAARLYYMRSEGYALIHESRGGNLVVIAVDVGGDERVIADSDTWPLMGEAGADGIPALAGVPSPDGRFVALYSSLDLDDANPPAENTFYKVVAIDDPHTELAALELAGYPRLVWRPDGAFIAFNEDQALEWREGESSFVPTTQPPCSWPDTTSSRTSADGTIVSTGIDFETPFIIDNDDPGVSGMPNIPFGCGA